MKQHLISMLEAFRTGDYDLATELFRTYAEKKVHYLITEDHQNYMTSDEMEKYIETLHKRTSDKPHFLKKLASYANLDTISERDFRKCAEDIQSKGKVYMDKVIHALEKIANNNIQENLLNVITLPVDSVVVGLPKIPNAYTTKKIKNNKKVLPKLNKGRYGTGYAPGAWHGDHDNDADANSAEGGGDGGD